MEYSMANREECLRQWSPPEQLNYKNIVYWSPTAKRLEGVKEGKAIITKARKFTELGLVSYDSATKTFTVSPIPGYNKTTYTIRSNNGHFACNCQFYNTVSKEWEHPSCSHIQAVKFYLEIYRWNEKKNRW